MFNKIEKLKKEKNAVILAHFYQPDEVQSIADITGDSLELAKAAKNIKADVIVFCGVDFMAESAKLLNPQKTVLLPIKDAFCPMAEMVTAQDVKNMRKKYPDAAVVTYINSSTEVKAESDICCTSANAVKIVNAMPQNEIIFLPDKNLGSYVSRFTDKKVILFNGYCPIHDRVAMNSVNRARTEHTNAKLAVHPECSSDVVKAADFCGSTSQILKYVNSSKEKEFIIGTEKGVLFELKKNNPDKLFYPLADDFICANMKKTTAADVLNALKNNINEIKLNPDLAKAAALSLKRMMDIC